jgi:hypothetical protein
MKMFEYLSDKELSDKLDVVLHKRYIAIIERDINAFYHFSKVEYGLRLYTNLKEKEIDMYKLAELADMAIDTLINMLVNEQPRGMSNLLSIEFYFLQILSQKNKKGK